ncbi:MAG: UDP-N-acetylmuramate dehydrogenase [Flavobacteriales bacterium]|nr:UDP-N-acetylmuramate dehydrogenase [Flavobacteriales bacterium]
MGEVSKNVSLKQFNTFGIEVQTNSFVEVNSIDKLKEVLKNNQSEILILGGGSNILFTKDFAGLIIKNNIKGIDVVDENDNEITLKVGSGEVWHDFVIYCVNRNYGGIENLSLIPGTVGACPIQNIGAYGVEVKDVIESVEAIDIKELTTISFSNKICEFDYRSSIFKTSAKGKYVITSVIFNLSKNPKINTSYGAIEDELKKTGVLKPSIIDVSNAVINIRKSKLPNPNEIGNAGSFFKNPTVSFAKKIQLLSEYPSMPNYLQKDGSFKLAAGWLIETCGLKGLQKGNCGIHKNQALVLVNYGGSSGNEILKLSEEIIEKVKSKFGVELEREVNII